ncbi:hypothetical protein BLNAU_18155 [Blattamonas nauphoetae]|uniref:NTF2 domain-containing protein n=1 Tax=Blattamonas nauphoetae TaxID=2049346 RepID=A0ABQ9X9I5_9EUKA|nr:hypothetical protein BLNAU_18155 [Blattamonas nauphoetae]
METNVGRKFSQQYYECLTSNPQQLMKFYMPETHVIVNEGGFTTQFTLSTEVQNHHAKYASSDIDLKMFTSFRFGEYYMIHCSGNISCSSQPQTFSHSFILKLVNKEAKQYSIFKEAFHIMTEPPTPPEDTESFYSSIHSEYDIDFQNPLTPFPQISLPIPSTDDLLEPRPQPTRSMPLRNLIPHYRVKSQQIHHSSNVSRQSLLSVTSTRSPTSPHPHHPGSMQRLSSSLPPVSHAEYFRSLEKPIENQETVSQEEPKRDIE